MPKPAITSAPETAHALLQQAEFDVELSSQIQRANDQRWGTAEDMRRLSALQLCAPELPDSEIFDVYDRVREAERSLIAPTMLAQDYLRGTAGVDNEVRTVYGGRLLLSAEHATEPPRKKGWGADHGTGGLAAVVAAQDGVDALIPIGRQTSNAVSDPEHAIKHAIRALLTPERLGFISLHGMTPNKVSGLLDDREIHALVGFGKDRPPSEATLAVTERAIAELEEELGLRLAIGNQTDFLLYTDNPGWDGKTFRDKADTLQYGNNGLPLVNRLEAGTPHTTVNFVLRETAGTPLAAMPNVQLELSRAVRLSPDDLYVRDRSRAAMGVYLGYRIVKKFVDNTYMLAGQN